MIENLLRQYHSFGSREEISKTIDSLRNAKSLPKRDLYTIGISIGTIEFLNYIQITREQKGRIKFIEDKHTQEMPLFIFEKLFTKLAEEQHLHEFINEKSVFIETETIFIKRKSIPLTFSAIRNLLIDFDLFLYDKLIESQFRVSPIYQDWFRQYVIPLIETSQLNNNPLSDLIERQKRQEAYGKEAEEFVLEYEKRNRKKHPTANKIRIISQQDVSAGYDIQSYVSDESLMLDKFIEVKSYQGNPHFYWSANEIKVAREKAEQYHLYLIDRDAMSDKSYEPTQIQNPAQSLFEDVQWTHKNDGYFFEQN